LELKKLNIFETAINAIHERLTDKQFMILSASLVGLSAGLAAVTLKWFVHVIRTYILEKYLLTLNFKYIYLLFPLLGIGLCILIVNRFFKNNISGGLTNILHAIAKKASFLPFHQMYSHIITSGVTVGFGGSAGLESPIVTTGSAIGANYARVYKLSYKERTLLLAAGAAGGIAGAFNSPIAGVLFAFEVILVDMSINAFIPLLIAAASGALISKIILGSSVLLSFKLLQPFNYYNVPFYILLGILAGFTSLYYVNFFVRTESFLRKKKSAFKKWLVGCSLLGLMFLVFPSLFGEGYESILSLSQLKPAEIFQESILSPFLNNSWMILLLVAATMFIKVFATAITIGSGGVGGNFAPSLFVGAYLGFVFSFLIKLLGIDLPVNNFTIVGMAGILSGVFHAPLTGIFLIAEITGGYELIIPLMLVSAISYLIVKNFHPESMDVKKLRAKGTSLSDDKDRNILGRLEMSDLVEKDFETIHLDETLRSIIEHIKQSKRNTFPVVYKSGNLAGIIYLDSIKDELFKPELYDTLTAKDLMEKASSKINLIKDDLSSAMKKFDESGQWNLPVVDQKSYVGFLSKSTILTNYRIELLGSL
jgi:chloride channel protein, CIC family